MKNFIVILLFGGLLNASLAHGQTPTPIATTCEESREEGADEASMRHSSAGWWFGGLGSGAALGLIGTVVIWQVASSSNPQPDSIPGYANEECYRGGYEAKARSSNKWGAGLGGVVGTIAMVAVLLSVITADAL